MKLWKIYNKVAFVYIALFLFGISLTDGANILFFYVVGAYSHRVQIEPLAHKLVELGHSVTFFTPLPPVKTHPKIVNFVTPEIQHLYDSSFTGFGDKGLPSRLKDKYSNFMVGSDVLFHLVELSCEAFLSSKNIKNWLDNEAKKFQLIILNQANKCGHGVSYKYNIPVIESSPTIFFLSEEDSYGFPLESSSVPRFHVKNIFTDEMTFYDRVFNVLNPIYYHLRANWVELPKFDERLKQLLDDPNLPPLSELEKRTSLLFINQHFSDDYSRSVPPFVVPVGGMHCVESNGSLPKEMEDFIAGSGEHGFVYVSFGSLVKMSKIPESLLNLFFDAVRDLKIHFLWKWDVDPPKNLPSNVFTSKWFPQQDVLAHPKIKGFVSQGGLMSLQQTIFHGVPMLVLPIVFDQPYNAHKIVKHGIGVHLELSELTVQNFKEGLIKLTQDETISKNMKMRSRQFRDRPMSPVDTAAWWVEYVLRHKDQVSILKPLGIHQYWWQRRLLDVWAFVFTIITLSTALLMFILFHILKFTYSRLTRKSTVVTSSKKTK